MMYEHSLLCHTRWNCDKVLHFISDYRQQEMLWNTKHSEYKNNRLKQETLGQLAVKYKCDIPSLKNKIKNIRTIFHREHRRVTASARPLSEGAPKWFAYDALQFIIDADAPMGDQYNKMDDSMNLDVTGDPLFIKQEEIELGETCLSEAPPPPPPTPSQPMAEMRRPANYKKSVTPTYPSHVSDDCSTYGEHVANEIRRLRPTAQIMTKHLINNVLFNAAMGKYDNPDVCAAATSMSSELMETMLDLPASCTTSNTPPSPDSPLTT